jgi:hypothetical protein
MVSAQFSYRLQNKNRAYFSQTWRKEMSRVLQSAPVPGVLYWSQWGNHLTLHILLREEQGLPREVQEKR